MLGLYKREYNKLAKLKVPKRQKKKMVCPLSTNALRSE
jgi:hypothetical protein